MKRTTIQICALLVALLSAGGVWGQKNKMPTGVTWTDIGAITSGTLGTSGTTSYHKLNVSISLTGGALQIRNGATVHLDLAGNTIDGKNSRRIFLNDNAKLYIYDSSASNDNGMNGTGRITNCTSAYGSPADVGGAICAQYSGNYIELNGGAITDSWVYDTNAGADAGGAVFIKGGANFVMNGGRISGCHTPNRGGAVYVYGTGTTATTSTFTMNGGLIEKCATTTTYASKTGYTTANMVNGGGAVKLGSSTSVFNMKGGTISGCTSGGFGMGINSEGKVNMSGGTIQKCHPSDINFERGDGEDDFEWNKTNILEWAKPEYEQYVYKRGGFGGGLFLYGSNAKFDFTGGKIEKCMAASGGGVVLWDGADMEMNGETAVLDNNWAVFLAEDQGVNIAGCGNGGAMYIENGTLDFTKGKMTNNLAIRYGGAINMNSTNAHLNLLGTCVFQGNMARHGGAIGLENGTLSLENSGILIEENTATGYGKYGVYHSAKPGEVKQSDDHDFNLTDVGEGCGGGILMESGTLNISAGKIEGNTSSAFGGGISFINYRTAAAMTIKMTGGSISGNTAKEYGGGIHVYTNHTAAIGINISAGTISGNTSGNKGGGIDIESSLTNPNIAVTLGVAGDASKPTLSDNEAPVSGGDIALSHGKLTIRNADISENTAGERGGAITMNAGSIEITDCNMVSNHAEGHTVGGVTTPGDGGAFAINDGNVTITHANVSGNTATGDGGGFFIRNGSLYIATCDISNNKASAGRGGGVYIENTDNAKKIINLSKADGKITYNEAKHGGGVCVNGLFTMTFAATIENNTAENGGGLCLLNGVDMTFTTGLIRDNKAIAGSTTPDFNTAYQGNTTNLTGVGGGIFLGTTGAETSLKFSDGNARTEPFGLYNNEAEIAADDIFASGNNTSIAIPKVRDMSLKGFQIPTSQLFWAEDYMTNDPGYNDGTKLRGEVSGTENDVCRYQDALKNVRTIYKLIEPSAGNDVSETTWNGYGRKYLCLSLGYAQVHLTLKKIGLKKGDNAGFVFSYLENPNEEDPQKYVYHPYREVFVHSDETQDEEGVEYEIVLPTGRWKVEESSWTSKYKVGPFSLQSKGTGGTYENVTGDKFDYATENKFCRFGLDSDKSYILTVENELKVNIRDAEFHKINIMTPLTW